MSQGRELRFGLCKPIECSYLPEQIEQLLVIDEEPGLRAQYYEKLLALGFRRCGDTLYRPACPACRACLPLRIEAACFVASKNQRKLHQRSKHFEARWQQQPSQDYFPLYQRYIDERHATSSMAPATRSQYQDFLQSSWATSHFLEIWHKDTLVSVSVTDVAHSALSAVYTFYEPSMQKYSIGTLAILEQLSYALKNDYLYLYLGYQIDDCRGMDYKRRFKPYQVFTDLGWQKIDS